MKSARQTGYFQHFFRVPLGLPAHAVKSATVSFSSSSDITSGICKGWMMAIGGAGDGDSILGTISWSQWGGGGCGYVYGGGNGEATACEICSFDWIVGLSPTAILFLIKAEQLLPTSGLMFKYNVSETDSIMACGNYVKVEWAKTGRCYSPTSWADLKTFPIRDTPVVTFEPKSFVLANFTNFAFSRIS